MNVRRGVEAAALAAVALAAPGRARADGAFPAGQAVLVPADRPQEIILATNFGLVMSEDGGQTWSWSCEQDGNALGMFYQLGPAPRHRLFVVANQQAVYSDDASCSWQIAGGLLAGEAVTDLFPDPTNADRVMAIGVANAAYSVFESADGGTTFGATLYQAQGGDTVNGVEIARSDPQIVYVALMSPDKSPELARTDDGGGHWIVNDLSADLGPGVLRIIAVDPNDANTVLLRWSSAADASEAIGVTRDGGATATKPLSIRNSFTSFARMPDGTLILSAVAAVSPVLTPTLYLSHDGGASFQENAAVPGVQALAQRDGILYAAADNFADGYALGSSSNEGVSFQAMVAFDQIASIVACLRTNAQCQASCEALAGKGLGSPGMIWDEAVCIGTPATDGGGGSTGAGAAGPTGGGGAGAAGSSGGGHGSSGGGCAVASGRPGSELGTAALVAALIAFTLRRRGKRPGRPARARSLFGALLCLLALGCGGGSTPQPMMCFGANVVANEKNDYAFSSQVTLSPVTVAPMSNLTFDWSGLSKDFLGRSLDPTKDLGAAILMIWDFPLATFETELNADALFTADLIAPPINLPLAGATSGRLYDFLINGTAVTPDMFNAYFDATKYTPDNSSFLVGVQTGTDLGRQIRMLQSFNLDASSGVTNVALTNTSMGLSYSANLHDLTITGVPGGTPALTLDWSQMTTNALGHEFTQGSVYSAVVGHYMQTPAALEADFLNLDSIAEVTYRADIPLGSVLDFTTLTDGSGAGFPGIDDTGTWLVGLICGNCRNPAPWYMTILKPCSM